MITIKKRDWIEIVLHIAFWVCVFYTLRSITELHIMIPDSGGKDFRIERDVQHNSLPRTFLMLGFLMLLFYGNTLWLFRKALHYRNILLRILLPLTWFCMMFVANYYSDLQLPQPGQGRQLMPKPGSGFLKTRANADLVLTEDHPVKPIRPSMFSEDNMARTVWFVYIIVFGLSIAYFFLKEWARAEKVRSKLEAVQLDTELKFLRSQINPHFLFNTLNNLFSMAQNRGNDELADGISKLSGMMRYMLYDSNAERVSLSTEITYLEEFITLNKLRYAQREVDVRLDYPSQTSGISIAPMLFIPFVENAFKHGVAIGQTTMVEISISISGQNLIFTCENSNHSAIKKMDVEKSGIGLENVKRRLELLYPGKHRLQINESNEKYNANLEINLA